MIALLAAAAAHAVTVEQVANPRERGGWVTDMAAILSPESESALNQRIEALHRDLTVEIAVVTVDRVDAPTPKDFATALFDRWGIGDDQANNGLLVLVVTGERRLEMETGYGLEAILPDGWLGTMQAAKMVPSFRRGDPAGALAAGLEEIDLRLRQHPEDARMGTGGPMASARNQVRTQQVVAAGGIGVGLVGGLVAAGLLVARHRRRERTCDKCGLYMPMLPDAVDDQHLTPGQQTEERVGSLDWQVHYCPSCGDVRSFARRAWLSGHRTCTSCGNRTRTSSRNTIQFATERSSGLVQVIEKCAHCGYRGTHIERTPPSSSSLGSSGGVRFGGGGGSSGGGGGSFGGGRSGGGGAGSSW